MTTRTGKKTAASAEERFLLQCLNRLPNADQRYIFTLVVDLISLGLANSKDREPKNAPEA